VTRIKATILTAGLASILALYGCSDGGSKTCQQLSDMNSNQRASALNNVLTNHGIDPARNVMEAGMAVTEIEMFCGMSWGGVRYGDSATQNLDRLIADGVDWSELHW